MRREEDVARVMRQAGEQRPSKRGGRLVLRIALLLTAALAVGVWLARDVPRRRVEAVLAGRLEARVRLGGLSLLGARSFLLRDLEVREMASEPRLERLRARELFVEGGLSEIASGRFERLRFVGTEIRLAPPSREPSAAAGEEEAPVRIGRLVLEPAAVVVTGPAGDATLEIEGELEGIGSDLAGEIRLRAATLPLAPLVALARAPDALARAPVGSASLDDAAATLRLSEGGTLATLAATARGARIPVARAEAVFGGARIEARAVSLPAEEKLAVEARAALEGAFESLWIAAEIDTAAASLVSGVGRVQRVNLGAVASLLPNLAEGASVIGEAELHLAKTAAREPIDYRLAAAIAEATVPIGDDRLRTQGASLALEGSAGLEGPAPGGPASLRLELPRLDGRIGGLAIPASIFPARILFEGEASAGEAPALEGRATLSSAATGEVAVSGRVALGADGPGGSLEVATRDLRLERLVALAREAGVQVPATIRAEGPVEGRGTIRGALASPVIEASLAFGPMTGSMAFDARPGDRENGREAREAFLREGKASAAIAWSPSRNGLSIRSLGVESRVEVPPLEPVALSIEAAGRIDPSSGAARVERAEMRVEGLGRFSASGGWSARGGGSFEARADGIDLPRWRSFLRPMTGPLAPGYEMRGSIDAALSGVVAEDLSWSASGSASLRGSGFGSEDGARVLEAPDTSWTVNAEGRSPSGPASIRAGTTVGGFQLLWDSLFVDYSSMRARVDLGARVGPAASSRGDAGAGDPVHGPMWSGEATLALPGEARVAASFGSLAGGGIAYRLDVDVRDIGGEFEQEAIAPLADTFPDIGRIRAGGAVGVRFEGALSEPLATVRGAVNLRGLDLEGAAGNMVVKGLDLDLPVDLAMRVTSVEPESTDPPTIAGEPRDGSLRFDRLVLAGMEFPPTTTALRIVADAVGLESSLTVPLLGGTLRFDRLTLADLFRSSRRLETSLLLQSVRVERLAETLGLPPLEGEVVGRFPRVRITPTTLQVDGGGEVSIFGGRLRFGDVSGENVLSPFPKITFSAEFDEIDLARVTRTFDFGEMTGIARGYVRNCDLFRGVPVRFEAQLEAEGRGGKTPVINVKAINNIAILGTGGKVGVFDRGIHKFLDRYTYEKLGIRMRLANDVFVLRGLERRGDRELLLKGKLPFRIDVVNANPGKTVSFRAMMDRVGSLDFSTATTGR